MEERTFCIACGSFCIVPNAKSTNTTYLVKTIPIPEELKLFNSNKNYHTVISKIINSIAGLKLTTSELNVLCEQCAALIEEYHRFCVEIKMIEQILTQQITENYKNVINGKTMSDIQLSTDLLWKPKYLPNKIYSRDSNGLYRCQDCPEFSTLKETTFISHVKCHQLRGQSFPFKRNKIKVTFDDTDEIFNELLKKNDRNPNFIDSHKLERLKLFGMHYKRDSAMSNTNERTFKCRYCTNTFQSKDFLRHHLQKAHKLKGKRCDEVFNDLTDRNEDVSNLPILNCEDCEAIFYKQELLYEHYLKKHMRCFKCKKKMRITSSLKVVQHNHYKYCILEKFKCLICGHLCASNSALRDHFTIHTGEQQHRCDLCPKKFSYAVGLNKHRNSIHIKELKYKCDVCGELFFNDDKYRAHKVLHKHPFPYPCKYEDCPERFKTPTLRASHIRIDHLKLFFHCESCGKQFKNGFEFKMHQQTHTKIGLYPCKYCSVRYTRFIILKNHYAKHHANEIAIEQINTKNSSEN